MLFLSTPHRGSNLAVTLNRLLAMTMLSPPPYIADISASSINLQRVLDEFRHVASEVQIVSFYETRQTAVGLKRVVSPFQFETYPPLSLMSYVLVGSRKGFGSHGMAWRDLQGSRH